MRAHVVGLFVSLALARPASASEDTTPVPADAQTAVDPVAATPAEPLAPRPDQASGIVVEDDRPTASIAPRVLLFIPRSLLWLAMQPIRGGVYVYERYDLGGRFVDATFTDDRRFGVYPVASYQSTFGFTVGGRVLFKDLAGEGERIRLRADYGGEFAYAVGAKASTGRRFGRVKFDVDSSLEARPRDHFYGIGNGPRLEGQPAQPIDPTMSSVSAESRFRDRVVRHVAAASFQITDILSARLSGAWMHRQFSRGDEYSIEERYDTSRLVGYATGVNALYGEQELTLDTRRPANPYTTQTIDATGWLLRGHFGLADGVDADMTNYFTYGGEVQRYFDLSRGMQTLTLRALVDGVGGTDGRTDGKIAFVDLPRLGGSDDLRGYPTGRFRDKMVALATAEYTWAIDNHASAYTFFDAGKPLATFDELADGRLRFGYGGGIQLHTKNTFFLRLQYARSRDGDNAINVVFSPAFGRQERVGRY